MIQLKKYIKPVILDLGTVMGEAGFSCGSGCQAGY